MPKTYTPAGAAEILNCSPDQVRALIAAKRLPAVNISLGSSRARWVISAESIDEFLRPAPTKTERQKRAPPSPKKQWV